MRKNWRCCQLYWKTSSSAVADKPARRAASRQMAKFLNRHVTTITPLLSVICHPVARIDIAYLCRKLDDFRFSRSSDMIEASKIFNGLHDLTMPYQRQFVVRRLWLTHSICTSNLESLRSPITKMHKETQNVVK